MVIRLVFSNPIMKAEVALIERNRSSPGRMDFEKGGISRGDVRWCSLSRGGSRMCDDCIFELQTELRLTLKLHDAINK